MKQLTYILLLSIAFIFLGCSVDSYVHDDSVRFVASQPESDQPESSKRDGIESETGNEGDFQTKITGTDFDAGEQIAVFAPLAGEAINGNYVNGALSLSRNKRYEADANNNFSAVGEKNKIRYYLNNKLDFYAVYPYESPDGDIVTLGSYVIDLGSIKDQNDDDPKKRLPPYMYSGNAKGLSADGDNNGSVKLVFQYVFAKIGMNVQYEPVHMGSVLNKVEMYAGGGLYYDCVIDLKLAHYSTVATNGGRTDKLATSVTPYVFGTPLVGGENITGGYILPNKVIDPIIRLTFGTRTTEIDTETGDVIVTEPKVYLVKIPTAEDSNGELVYKAGSKYDYTITINDYGDGSMEDTVTITAVITSWDVIGIPPIDAL